MLWMHSSFRWRFAMVSVPSLGLEAGSRESLGMVWRQFLCEDVKE